MNLKTVFVFLFIFFIITPFLVADNRYVGASECKLCHQKKKAGAQFVIWSKSKHSKAYQVLSSPKAGEFAQKLGFKTDPQKEKACLVCHVRSQFDQNGNQKPASLFEKKYQIEDGVQCEDCHGPGEKYAKIKIMKIITHDEGGAAKSATAKKTGLWVSDEATCKQCHVPELKLGDVVYQNPTFKTFDFAKQYEQIKHPIPSN